MLAVSDSYERPGQTADAPMPHHSARLAFGPRLVVSTMLSGVTTRGQRKSMHARGRLPFVLIAVACLVAGGCASGHAPHLSPSAPSEEVRASLGRIGIRSGPASPSGEWNMPAKGAAEGAK
jgi:hypothetical protein